ncbi:MAG: hypothetical protein A4E70_00524 [Syntrophus sp. PtaU1.Bin005]|jgi:hypothetical protein|nr:MAG: hypothetical protein A4E69_03160 [Syntrophus sp. PtaB.Bin138]OPY82909.1 MAG: hypothetical protein A4E70_00524 [Syntrophus sp. PtaU1.Bin005]
MKTIPSMICSFFLILLLLPDPAVGSSDWVEYGRSDQGDIYLYHPATMKQKTKDIMQVWVKVVFSDKGKKHYAQWLKNKGEPVEGYEKLSHTLSLMEIDAKSPRFRILYGSEYDMDDKELFRGSRDAPWKDILPRSTQERLKNNILK